MPSKNGPIGDDELDGLFGRGDVPLALAVSGGADSMALMHLVARWAGRADVMAAWAEQCRALLEPPNTQLPKRAPLDRRGLAAPCWLAGIDSFAALDATGGPPHVVVLTVDHGLRPEAAREAAFVAEEAERLGLPCEVLRWHGPKPATGIQDAAREARRDLMLDCLRAEEAILTELANSENRERHLHARRTLVLAHHQEDQAETVLMRLARGSGLEGLAGMRVMSRATRGPTAERPASFGAHVWRPLIDVPKQRLIDTLKAGGHAWVQDPSNTDERFERVRIRKALASLGEVGVTAEKIALSARRLADADRALDGLMALAHRHYASDNSFTALMAEQSLRDPEFSSHYLATRTLRRLLQAYGGSAREPELAQVEALAAELMSEKSRASFAGVTLGGCKIEVVGDRDRLRIYREGGGEGLPVMELEPGRKFEWDGGRFSGSAPSHFKPGAAITALGRAGWAGLKREVPELADLGWPAAAVATLPVVVRENEVVDVPCLGELLRQLAGVASPAATAWSARQARCEQGVFTRFAGVPPVRDGQPCFDCNLKLP